MDPEIGFSVAAPDHWILIDLTKPDVEQTLAALSLKYMHIYLVFESALAGTAGFEQRVASVDLDRDHWKPDAAPTFDVGISESPDGRDIQLILAEYASSFTQDYPDWTLLSAGVTETQGGIPVAVVDVEYAYENFAGEPTTFHFRRGWFRVGDRLGVLSIAEPFGHIPDLEPAIEEITNSIELLPGG